MIHRDTGEWVSSSEGPLTLSPSPCHLSPCPGPFFHHPFPGWPPPWILSLQPILTGQFCGSLRSPTGDPALSLCLCIFHAPQCCHTLSKLVSRTPARPGPGAALSAGWTLCSLDQAGRAASSKPPLALETLAGGRPCTMFHFPKLT